MSAEMTAELSAELVPTVRLVQLRPRHVVAVAAVMVAMVVGALMSAPGRAAACDALSIPSVGVERCVVEGDQAEIDAGHAVRFTAFSSDSVQWLAGHRTASGGTFGALTGLVAGDHVGYRGTTYAIAEYRLVNRFQPELVDDWMFAETPTLVLQTSADSNHVHVWMATPVVAQMSGTVPSTTAPATTVPETSTTVVPATTVPTTTSTSIVPATTVPPIDAVELVDAVGERFDSLVSLLPSLAWG